MLAFSFWCLWAPWPEEGPAFLDTSAQIALSQCLQAIRLIWYSVVVKYWSPCSTVHLHTIPLWGIETILGDDFSTEGSQVRGQEFK